MESTEDTEYLKDSITFHGVQQEEMIRISSEGFWVRGVKVPQDDKEAENVYNAFTAWLAWAELNRQ